MTTLDHVRAALALPDFDSRAAQARMAPSERPFLPPLSEKTRLAAVLALLYPFEPDGAELAFALMRRNEYPGVHSGQISLPGGSCEPGESWEQTALRETCEEFGVCDGVTILGLLTPLYVPPSDFEIHPVVGALAVRPTFKPDPHEVAQILEVPLRDLLSADSKGESERPVADGVVVRIRHYRLCDHVVWGATAIILSEFEQRLRAVMPSAGDGM